MDAMRARRPGASGNRSFKRFDFARGSNLPTERYVLTSSGEEGTACSQTSIMHHW